MRLTHAVYLIAGQSQMTRARKHGRQALPQLRDI